MKTEDLVDKSMSGINSGGNAFKRNEVTHLSKAVDDNKDTGKTIRGREVRNEVHGNGGPRKISDIKRV